MSTSDPDRRTQGGAAGYDASDPDSVWRRPATDAEPAADPTPEFPAEPRYAGPPQSARPNHGWRTPTVVNAPPPRELPAQDLAAIEDAEAKARTFTYGLGLLVGAILLVMLLVVCLRAIS